MTSSQDLDGNTCQPDGQAVEPRRSQRQRHPTEKMRALKEEEVKKCEDSLLLVYERWRIQVRMLKSSVKHENDHDDVAKLMDTVKDNENCVVRAFESLRLVGTPSSSILRKVDACNSITREIISIANQYIAGLDDLDPDKWTSIRKNEYANSIFSWTTNHSKESSSSKLHEKICDAAADLAVKKAELAATQYEEERLAEIDRLEQQHQRKMEEHKRELQRIKLEQSINVAQARLNAYSELAINENNCTLPSFSVDQQHLQEAKPKVNPSSCSPQPVPAFSMENAVHAPVFQPTNAVALGEYQPSPHLPVNVHQAPYAAQDGDSLARAIASSMNFNRLPVPEPNIFLGDPLSYLEWRTAFKMLIEQKNISSQERIYYLKRYVGEPVRKALQGYYMNSSPLAYNNAMKLLDERYRHPFVMQKAYRDKLDRWPRVPPKDQMALRDFADFLLSCRDAINYIPSLSILNDCTENQRLLHKLPDWAAVRWNREVTATLDNTQIFPTFSQFVDFVMKEARIACNSVSSLYALHDTDAKPKSSNGHSSHVKVLATAATDQSSEVDKRTFTCEYCQKEGHPIFKYNGFTAISLEERRAVVKAKKLCFGCLRKGHLSKDCKKKHVCGKCKGKHPTCLHDETFQRTQTTLVAESQISSASSLHVSRSQGQCTSMIVPVWVSTKTNPSYEVLTYAILDTQSDTTFILEETSASLQLPKHRVHLSLSTMTAQHTAIESNKVSNILVQGFQSSEYVCIDEAYTRDFIPANRTNIPVRETVGHWPHLQQLSNKLPPLQSCDIGLLIGLNCPQALVPRKTLVGRSNEPYAIETSLGWSIVGRTDTNADGSTHICHHVVMREVIPSTKLYPFAEKDLGSNTKNTNISQDDAQKRNMNFKHVKQITNKALDRHVTNLDMKQTSERNQHQAPSTHVMDLDTNNNNVKKNTNCALSSQCNIYSLGVSFPHLVAFIVSVVFLGFCLQHACYEQNVDFNNSLLIGELKCSYCKSFSYIKITKGVPLRDFQACMWQRFQRNIHVDDITLAMNVDTARYQWPMGIVVEAKPDKDKLVRRVKIKLGRKGGSETTVLERCIHKLVLLIEH